MKKFLTKAVSAMSAVALLATASIPGFAAQITDSKDFAVQYTSDANSHKAKIIVSNSSEQTRSFDLFTAVYDAEDSSILDAVSVASHSVEAGKTAAFESDAITADSTDSIKVYAWENLKPLEYGTDFRTLSKNAYLSDLKVGDYDVNVDNENKKIYVNTDSIIADAEITDIKVSENATYVVADDKSSVTVTSEDGLTENTFEFVAQSGLYIDFEDGTVGEEPAGWTIDTRENCLEEVALDPFDSTNKVFMLDDKNISTGNDGKIGARYDFDTIEPPFSVSYKIMYDRDGEYADDGASATGTWFHVRNSDTNIMAVGSQDIGKEIRYNVQHGLNEDGTGSISYKTKTGNKNKTWHEIKMVCLAEDEAYFYVDGELFFSGTPTFWLGVNRLHFFSSTTRTSKTYIDDILVRSMKCELKKISFTDGTNELNGIIRDGKVYVNTSDLSKLSMASYVASAEGTAAYENGVVTVTSPEGQSAAYKVCAFEGVALDFENTELGSAPSGWSLLGMTDSTATVDADPEDATNKVFKIDDTVITDKVSAYYNFTAIAAPFSVSYKVMYDRDDEYSSTGGSSPVTWTHARNSSTDIVSVGSNDNGSNQKFMTKSAEGENGNASIKLGNWYDVEMVVMSASEAYFYVDGSLIYTGTPINYLAVSRFNYVSSDKLTSTAYFDDIIVRPYYLEPCELESISFADGENALESYIYENKVFVKAESLENVTLSNVTVSENCTYTYENAVITVTSEEGQTVEYSVQAQDYFTETFDGFDEGDFATSTNYYVSFDTIKTKGGSVSAVVSTEDSDKILVLTDSDGDGSNGARSMVTIRNTAQAGADEFIVEYTARYDYISGESYSNKISDFGYAPVEIRDSLSAKLGRFQPTTRKSANATGDIYNLGAMRYSVEDKDKDNTVSTVKAGEWNKYRIVYTKNSDSTVAYAKYYVNDKFVGTQSISNVSQLATVFISTSTVRKSVFSIDDIKIISLD